jgi:hypothetical protein
MIGESKKYQYLCVICKLAKPLQIPKKWGRPELTGWR